MGVTPSASHNSLHISEFVKMKVTRGITPFAFHNNVLTERHTKNTATLTLTPPLLPQIHRQW
jgi:hypothetical protein